MSDVPDTIATALEEIPITGRTCLEAGAGAGNATAALRERGADRVYAVTNDTDHAETVRDRFRDDDATATVFADLRAIPLPDDAVEVVTAHALFNVVTTTEATPIVEELTRVTAPGGWLVVDDYAPVPDETVRELFGLANAVAELTDARPTFTFYPRDHLRALFSATGWELADSRTLLDPVPWTADLLDAHANIIGEELESLPDDVGDGLRNRLRAVRRRAGDGVETGTMYSLVFRLPE